MKHLFKTMNWKFALGVLLVALLMPAAVMAAQDGGDIDFSDPAALVASLTTLITLLAGWLSHQAAKLPGIWTLIIVGALSAALPKVTAWLGEPGLSYLEQFGLGILSTFLHQFQLKFNSARKGK